MSDSLLVQNLEVGNSKFCYELTYRAIQKKTTIYRGSLSWPTIGISIQKKTTITKNLLS